MREPVTAQAPSNIALVKYMGKRPSTEDAALNLPVNPSVSLTLEGLRTETEVALIAGSGPRIRWMGEPPRGGAPRKGQVPNLGDAAVQKLARHAERVLAEASEILRASGVEALDAAELSGTLEVRSINGFPTGAGIASSASGFAALTLALAGTLVRDRESFKKAWALEPELRRRLGALSRRGSGSSCRSFEGPWVLWEEAENHRIGSPLSSMAHFVLLVSRVEKPVSSSQAHKHVETSPLWNGRPERARSRAQAASLALSSGDWESLARLAWQDAWEMHSLFHTAEEPFTYWLPESLRCLRALGALRTSQQLPVTPMVTMDAGPNVHVTVPSAHRDVLHAWLRRELPDFEVLEDRGGTGASLL